jgi:hypothetical protein
LSKPKQGFVKVGITIPDDTAKMLKHAAVETNQTIGTIATIALKMFLAENTKQLVQT